MSYVVMTCVCICLLQTFIASIVPLPVKLNLHRQIDLIENCSAQIITLDLYLSYCPSLM